MGEEFKSLSVEDKIYNLTLQKKNLKEKVVKLNLQLEAIDKKIAKLGTKSKNSQL